MIENPMEYAARWLLTELYEHPEVPLAIDTETTGLRFFDKTIGVSWATVIDGRPNSYYVATDHAVGPNISQETLDMLLYVLSQPRPLVFANAQFDLLKLEGLGIRLDDHEFYDVAAMAHLIDENEPFQGKSLDMLAQFYLGEKGKVEEFAHIKEYLDGGGKLGVRAQYQRKHTLKWQKENGWPDTSWEMIHEYARADAETTFRLLPVLLDHPEWRELPEDIWQEKQDIVRVLLEMGRRGIRIDEELSQQYIDLGEAEMERLRAEIGLNPASRNDLRELFIERLGLPVVKKSAKTGEPSFDKDVMAEYDAMLEIVDTPEAKLVKEFRGWQKAVSASYRPYLDLLDQDGRLRTSYKLHGTTTGRFSASTPNLQQIPKESDKPWNGKVKECFISEEGYTLLNADFSQLELRLGTCYAGEAQLREVFEEGRDIFTEMSKQLGMTRQDTKTLVYSIQYGAGINRIMHAFRVSKQRAMEIRDTYFSTYPRFKNLADICSNRVRSNGKIRLWSGRYRHFQHPDSEDYKAMNSLIQGGAADIMERVMIRAFKELDNDDCRMLIQVHDSLTWEVKSELVPVYWPKIKELMSDVVGATGMEEFDVRFNVDVGFWTDREAADWHEQFGELELTA